MAAIWSDPDFLALPEGPQRLYMFLLSQPDLSHAGLVPMRIGRWAKKVAGGTRELIEGHIATLSDSRFVVADMDTEELLVRTFVRNDGVYKQPKVMLRMREDASQIESAVLRAAFRVELDRLPLDELSDKPGGPGGDQPSTREQVERVVETLRQDFTPDAQYLSERVSGRVSDTLPSPETGESGQPAGQEGSGYPSEGVSDTPRVRAGAFPQPPSPVPQPPATIPATPGRGEPGTELAIVDDAPTAQTLVAEWIDHCAEPPPGRVKGQVAKELKALLDEGIDPHRIRAALAEWNRKGLHPSTLASVVHEIGNRAPATTNKQQATTEMFNRQMARAVEREREMGLRP
jgi:hypothetical protein